VVRRLIDRVADEGVSVGGFFTQEVRKDGRRVGFEVEDLAGNRAVLAAAGLSSDVRVGKYGVDIDAFERIALPALRRGQNELVVIDELGKMELASAAFTRAVQELFERDGAIVATVHLFRHPITDALKARRDVDLIRIVARERDELPARLVERLRASR
jgi:nucleoside-triphosphatase